MLGRALLPSSVRSFCLQIQEAVLNVPTAQSTRRVKERVGGVYPCIFKLIFTGRGWRKGAGEEKHWFVGPLIYAFTRCFLDVP